MLMDILLSIAVMAPNRVFFDPCAETARLLIRRQVWAETAAMRLEPDTLDDPSLTDPGIYFESVSSGIDGVRIFRGRTQISHWHAYVLACHQDRVYRMAGFEDSDIQEFSRAVRHRIGSETEAVGFATLIAKTTDPRLTESFVISSIEQADTGISAIISKWRMLRPATWPRESTTRFSDGSFGIVLTRISHDGVSIQTATLCSIMIDIEGQILAKSCFTRDMSRQIPQEGGP